MCIHKLSPFLEFTFLKKVYSVQERAILVKSSPSQEDVISPHGSSTPSLVPDLEDAFFSAPSAWLDFYIQFTSNKTLLLHRALVIRLYILAQNLWAESVDYISSATIKCSEQN